MIERSRSETQAAEERLESDEIIEREISTSPSPHHRTPRQRPRPEPGWTPRTNMMMMTNKQLWRIAVDHLNPRQWEAFWLRHVDELSYEEIGERMGISDRAASRHVSKAVKIIYEKAKEKEAA